MVRWMRRTLELLKQRSCAACVKIGMKLSVDTVRRNAE